MDNIWLICEIQNGHKEAVFCLKTMHICYVLTQDSLIMADLFYIWYADWYGVYSVE
jgi:hypothetical protein